MRAPTAFDFTAESPKPSHRHEYLQSPKLLIAGLFVAALALPMAGVSAQEAAPELTSDSVVAEDSAVAEGAASELPSAESAEPVLPDSPSIESAEPATPGEVSANSLSAESAEASPAEASSEGAEAAAALSAPEAAAEQAQAESAAAPAGPQSLLNNLSELLEPSKEGSEAAPDLSPIGMFRGADIVVKLVMLGLVFASLVTWTIWFSKSVEIAGAARRARRVLQIVNGAANMAEATERAGDKGGPAADMLRAVKAETRFSEPVVDHVDGAGLKERVTSVLDQISARAGRRASVGTGILATIGSTAPFVGLFGTVWGIMNAFIGISEAQSSSLAVVAPGIAEALLATALGLVAAIPAVIIYNACVRWITGYRHILSEVAAGIERLISRDLDFRQVPVERRLDAQAAE